MGRGIQRRHASSRRSETRMDNASWVPEMLFGTIPSDPLHNLREKKKLAGLKTGISDTILEGLYLLETWNIKVFFKIRKTQTKQTLLSLKQHLTKLRIQELFSPHFRGNRTMEIQGLHLLASLFFPVLMQKASFFHFIFGTRLITQQEQLQKAAQKERQTEKNQVEFMARFGPMTNIYHYSQRKSNSMKSFEVMDENDTEKIV